MRIEAMKQALEALELMYSCYAQPDWISHKQQEDKILAQCVATTKTIRQAIAEAEQEKWRLVMIDALADTDPERESALDAVLAAAPAQPKAKQEPVAWPAIESILNEYGLQAIDFVADFKKAMEKVEKQEPVAWGMQHDDGSIYDCITPEEHARLEGEYKTPLYTHPQPKQEPVAWMYQSKADSTPCFMQDKKDWAESGSGIWTETPLYTHPQPTEERNFCPRCGKRTADLTVIHTCMPPKDTYTRPQPLTDEQIEEIAKQARSKAHAVTLTIKSLKKNT